MNKYQFGLIGIALFIILQIAAWLLNKDGAVLALVSSGISAILAFVLGIEFRKPPNKAKTDTLEG